MSGPPLPPLAFHTVSIIPSSNVVVVIGGTSCGVGSVYVLTPDGLGWSASSQGTAGTAPPCVWGHTSTLLDESEPLLFVYGGCTGDYTGGVSCMSANPSAYTLSLSGDVWEWQQLTVTGGSTVEARYMHAAAPLNNGVFVYGGLAAGNAFLYDVHHFSATARCV